jgi:hypothetical protein
MAALLGRENAKAGQKLTSAAALYAVGELELWRSSYALIPLPSAALALIVTLAVSALIEWAYLRWTGRRLHRLAEAPGEEYPPECGQSPRSR